MSLNRAFVSSQTRCVILVITFTNKNSYREGHSRQGRSVNVMGETMDMSVLRRSGRVAGSIAKCGLYVCCLREY